MRKKIFFVLMAVMTILCGCHQKNEVVKIGVIAPLTGSASSTKQYVMDGFTMAKEELNARQEGVKYEIIFEDCKSDPAEAVACFTRLKTKGVKYIVAFGGQFALAVAPSTKNQDMLYFTLADYNEAVLDLTDCGFRVYPSATTIADISASFLRDSLKISNVATITMNTVPCLMASDRFTKNILAKGVNVNFQDTYDMGTSDFKNIISKMTDKEIDAVFFNGFGISPAAFCSQLASLPQFDNLIVLGDVNFATKTFSDNNKNNKSRIYYADSEMGGDAGMLYQQKHNIRPNGLVGCSYMLPYIVDEAIRMAGDKNNLSAQKQALRNHTISTPAGEISFDAKGNGNMGMKIYALH